jgi:hypothetical protein
MSYTQNDYTHLNTLRNNGCAKNVCTYIAGLIPQSLQLQAQVTLANMG